MRKQCGLSAVCKWVAVWRVSVNVCRAVRWESGLPHRKKSPKNKTKAKNPNNHGNTRLTVSIRRESYVSAPFETSARPATVGRSVTLLRHLSARRRAVQLFPRRPLRITGSITDLVRTTVRLFSSLGERGAANWIDWLHCRKPYRVQTLATGRRSPLQATKKWHFQNEMVTKCLNRTHVQFEWETNVVNKELMIALEK